MVAVKYISYLKSAQYFVTITRALDHEVVAAVEKQKVSKLWSGLRPEWAQHARVPDPDLSGEVMERAI